MGTWRGSDSRVIIDATTSDMVAPTTGTSSASPAIMPRITARGTPNAHSDRAMTTPTSTAISSCIRM